MGRFYPGVIGEVKGKLGEIVIRSMNHKAFFSVRPSHYRKSSNPEALLTRYNFTAAAQLAKLTIRDSLLCAIWKASSIKGTSPYHKILKTNIIHVKEGMITEKFLLIPPSAYQIELNAAIENDGCKIVFGKNESSLIDSFSKESILQLIFLLFPKDYKYKVPFSLKHYSLKITDVSFEQGSELIIPLPSNYMQEISSAYKRIIFLSFIVINQDDFSIIWTSSPSLKI